MKTVLFVDDEPNVLAGLKRMLRCQRNEWTMEFVSGGQAALDYMAQHKVDVLVTDLRMPGMDGAELLQVVVAEYPDIVRIALSGQSDKEVIIRIAGLAHQYLSKPCDTETLKATVCRACALRDYLANDRLKRLVSGMRSIPSLPTNYQEMLTELNAPEPSLAAIGDIIARDLAMTAKMLQLVNSAFFGIPRKVTNAAQAASLLGVTTVHGLVLSAGVFSQFEDCDLAQFTVDDLIEHSLQVATLAKQIATRQSNDPALQNDAFVGGLLHDVGKLVLATNFPRQYGRVVAEAENRAMLLGEAERQVFGASHADVGAYLLSLWGLPATLIEAVAFHQSPAKSQTTNFTALTAVHVADAFIHVGKPGHMGEHKVPLDRAYLNTIGVSDRLPIWKSLADANQLVGATS